MAARAKKILAKRFADAISEHCRDLEHAYVYWMFCARKIYILKQMKKPKPCITLW